MENTGNKSIAATRINFLGPAQLQTGVAFSRTKPLLIYDDMKALAPHSSHRVMLHSSGLPRTIGPLHSQDIPCNVISVRYADGSTWVIEPGIATPGD